MTPAEPSRPGRRWSGRGARAPEENPLGSAVVILFFVLGMYLSASGALAAARQAPSESLLPLIESGGGFAIVSVILFVYSAHPRTRPNSASISLAVMKTLMMLGGFVLFVGGAFGAIKTTDFSEQMALALVSIYFIAVPLGLHLTMR